MLGLDTHLIPNRGYLSEAHLCKVVGGEPGKGGTSLSAMIDGGQPWRRSILIIFSDLLNTLFCCRTFGDNLIYTDWQRDNYFRAVKVKHKSTSQLEAFKVKWSL